MRKAQYSILAGLLFLSFLPLRREAAQATGFYRADLRDGASWLFTPDQEPVLLRAVTHVHLISASAPQTDLSPAYIDQRSAAIVAGLRQDGFNALGGDADADLWHRGLPFLQLLSFSEHLQAAQQTALFDVYAPDFPAQVEALAQAAGSPQRQDRELIGYVSDAGLGWDPATHPEVALTYYLGLPIASPGRRRAIDTLRLRYHDRLADLNRAWGTKARDFTSVAPPSPATAAFVADAGTFAEDVLARYLQVTANAIHSADPNHLYLGAELHLDTAQLAAAAADSNTVLVWSIADVNSIAAAPGQDPAALVQAISRAGGQPALLVVSGCSQVPPLGLFRAPAFLGYIWSPSGDWQSGLCGQEARQQWEQLNRQSALLHRQSGSRQPDSAETKQ